MKKKQNKLMYVQFLDQNNLESEISARREILKPFKKLDNTLLLVFETVLNRLSDVHQI